MNDKIASAVPVDFDPFASGRIDAIVPVTAAQREIWVAAQVSPEASCAFNQSIAITLQGALDREALGRAINIVVERHEALRGSFTPDGRSFCIAPSAVIDLGFFELESSDGEYVARQLRRHACEEAETPFDLGQAPLMRVKLVRNGPEQHVLIVTAHHIIADGWSNGVIVSDLAAAYTGLTGQAADPGHESPFGFASYVAWLEEPAQKSAQQSALDYWTAVHEPCAPVLELPLDHRRPARRTFACDTVLHTVDPVLVSDVKKAGSAHRCTFFATLLAGFSAYLGKLTGQSEFVVGVPAAGQAAAGQPGLVGHCTNMLPIRIEVRGDEPFTALIKRVRGIVLDAFEHQQLTFTELLPRLKLARDPARVPLVSVTFNVDRIVGGLQFGQLNASLEASPRQYDNFEWTFNFIEAGDAAKIEVTFNTSLFERSVMVGRLREFEGLLRAIVRNMDSPLSELGLLRAEDRERQLVVWNATERGYPRESLPAYLRRGPVDCSAEALVMAGVSLSYEELERRSNRLARHLRALGAGRGELIGLSMERSPELVIAMLGILKSGAGYLPLDPAFPPDRLSFMLEDSGAGMLVTEVELRSSLPAFAGTTVCVDGDAEEISGQSDAPLELLSGPDDRAYVIYTSGSTGRPKGVQVLHRNVVNFLHSMAREPGMTAKDRLLAVTTLSFDISVLELLLPLSVGATVVLANRETAADGIGLRDLLERERISVMQATPSTWRLLLSAGWQGDRTLKVLCGGEALPADLAEALAPRVGELWNLYGPTETTVWSSCYRVAGEGPILIGRPIDNTRMYVLDAQREPVPVGVYGELYIGGAGVSDGYLNRPDLTAERFVEDPFVTGGRLYRTGDRVRYRADGALEYHSRMDNQVKVRGFRIELGEIETALASYPGLQETAVTVREDQPGDQRLVAYYVVAKGQAVPTASELRSHLRQNLPDYMLPQHFCELQDMPRTPNNKLDRKALPALSEQQAPASREHVEPATPTEKALAELWRDILDVRQVGKGDNFFDLGGHSLASVRVIAWAKRTHGATLHPLSLVTDSLAAIAREIDRHRAAEPAEDRKPWKSLVQRMFGELKSASSP